MTRPGSGRAIVVLKKPGTTQVLKDVTDDFVLMQATEVLMGGGDGVETLYEVRHENGEVLEVEVTVRITGQRKETI